MKIDQNDAENLVQWYNENKRDLPWRNTGDPYDVWLSEIMCQQTRIEFVKPRFTAFKQTLPTIQILAQCPEDTLMKLWEGMGYYSRARNLKKCASVIVSEYNGTIPDQYAELIKLPGIGPYTAGAIASLAYGQPEPAVDGNVLRVLARYFNDDTDIRNRAVKVRCEEMIRNLFHQKQADAAFISSFNQGLMELGALICIPNGTPHCSSCPWISSCQSHRCNTTGTIPYRSPLKKRRIIDRTIIVIRDGDTFLLQKRPASGLLANLYEFPGAEGHLSSEEILDFVQKHGFEAIRLRHLPETRHIFSHLEWNMIAYEIQIASVEHPENYLLLTKKELLQYAIPSAFRAYTSYYSLTD